MSVPAVEKREEGRIIRDPRFTLPEALLFIPIGVAFLLLDDWLFPWPIGIAAILTIVVGVAVAGMFYRPKWVRVGPRGVAFRSWLQAAQFGWGEIESFEVGNPAVPDVAYLRLRRGGGLSSSTIRLPAFRTVPPAELAEALRREQRRYAGP